MGKMLWHTVPRAKVKQERKVLAGQQAQRRMNQKMRKRRRSRKRRNNKRHPKMCRVYALRQLFCEECEIQTQSFHQCKLPCIVPISATRKYYTKHTNYDFFKKLTIHVYLLYILRAKNLNSQFPQHPFILNW